VRLDAAERMDVLTWYQADAGIFEQKLRELLRSRGFEHLTGDVRDLAREVRLFTTRDGAQGYEAIEPDKIDRLQRRLRAAVADPHSDAVEKCSHLLRRVPRFDFRYDAGLLS
jgi:hypothetical protein